MARLTISDAIAKTDSAYLANEENQALIGDTASAERVFARPTISSCCQTTIMAKSTGVGCLEIKDPEGKNRLENSACSARNASETAGQSHGDGTGREPGCHRFMVTPHDAGQRLDIYLAGRLPGISRSMLGQLIRAGRVLVNNVVKKSGLRVKNRDEITIDIPPPAPAAIVPVQVDFIRIYEDDDLLVISKPPGIVVHPACGHQEGTLVHGLLFHCRELAGISGEQRPGIVHRLDKDTSGLMVVAKNDKSHQGLVRLFKARKVGKIYHAILVGRPNSHTGRIALPIGRHPVHRKKMAVLEQAGREAATRWRVLEELTDPFTYVELRPETGRTHQLRVHMAYLGHPIIGDRLYGGKGSAISPVPVKRHCLHALSLTFQHPVSRKEMSFTAPLWPDMIEVLARLRVDK